jgi:hypothetical protein
MSVDWTGCDVEVGGRGVGVALGGTWVDVAVGGTAVAVGVALGCGEATTTGPGVSAWRSPPRQATSPRANSRIQVKANGNLRSTQTSRA